MFFYNIYIYVYVYYIIDKTRLIHPFIMSIIINYWNLIINTAYRALLS